MFGECAGHVFMSKSFFRSLHCFSSQSIVIGYPFCLGTFSQNVKELVNKTQVHTLNTWCMNWAAINTLKTTRIHFSGLRFPAKMSIANSFFQLTRFPKFADLNTWLMQPSSCQILFSIMQRSNSILAAVILKICIYVSHFRVVIDAGKCSKNQINNGFNMLDLFRFLSEMVKTCWSWYKFSACFTIWFMTGNQLILWHRFGDIDLRSLDRSLQILFVDKIKD